MSANGNWIAAALFLAVTGCGAPSQQAEAGDGSEDAQLSAALDPCAANSALCASKDMAALGGQVRQALFEAASDVSAEGAQVIADNQKSWLEAQRSLCGVAPAAKQLTAAQEACVRAAMEKRAKEAASIVEKKGPFTFQRVEINETSAVQAQAAGDDDGAAVSREIAYPRIDGDSPIIKKFNEAVKRQPRFRLDQKTEEQTRYQIGHASEDVVSVRFDDYDFTSGASGPNKAARAVTMNMRTGEPVSAADIFRAGAKWQDFLAQRVARDVTAALKDQDEMALPVAASEVRAAVAKPEAWYVTDTALVILLPATAFSRPMQVGPQEVSLPWQDLRPYLNANGLGPAKG